MGVDTITMKVRDTVLHYKDVTNTEGVDISNDVELQDVMNAEGSDISTDGDFFTKMQSSNLSNWHVSSMPESIECSLLTYLPSQPSKIKFYLTVYKNLHWAVRQLAS